MLRLLSEVHQLLFVFISINWSLAYMYEEHIQPSEEIVQTVHQQLESVPEFTNYLNRNTDQSDYSNLIAPFPEIDARGFHELVFDGLEDRNPTWRKKRMPFGINARGFHDDVFEQDFGNFNTFKKRSISKIEHPPNTRRKREAAAKEPTNEVKLSKEKNENEQKRNLNSDSQSVQQYLAAGLHSKRMPLSDDAHEAFYGSFEGFAPMKRLSQEKRISRNGDGMFTHGFGDFETMKKRLNNYIRDRRRMGMGSAGFHGDTFTGGFGDFDTMKKRRPGNGFHGDTFTHGFGDFETMKRRPMSDFHGDTFTGGFGDFDTMKKRRPMSDFHGDTFTGGFGDFDTMKKRRPMSDFHGDTFTGGFGDFDTMKKRRPMSDFHGDTFTGGFGDFDTMKKRRPMSDFHGDTFTGGFGDFDTMKKRRPMSDFHGDTFTGGFGDFDTMKKRRPGNGFYGDTFTQGFGDFDTMRRKRNSL